MTPAMRAASASRPSQSPVANPATPTATATNWSVASRSEWISTPDQTGTNCVIAPIIVRHTPPRGAGARLRSRRGRDPFASPATRGREGSASDEKRQRDEEVAKRDRGRRARRGREITGERPRMCASRSRAAPVVVSERVRGSVRLRAGRRSVDGNPRTRSEQTTRGGDPIDAYGTGNGCARTDGRTGGPTRRDARRFAISARRSRSAKRSNCSPTSPTRPCWSSATTARRSSSTRSSTTAATLTRRSRPTERSSAAIWMAGDDTGVSDETVADGTDEEGDR